MEAAKSHLAAAELAEQRTTIRAPFTGLVLEESVEKGQFVGNSLKSQPWLQLIRSGSRSPVPLSLLDRIHFPEKSEEQASRALIILEKGYGASQRSVRGQSLNC